MNATWYGLPPPPKAATESNENPNDSALVRAVPGLEDASPILGAGREVEVREDGVADPTAHDHQHIAHHEPRARGHRVKERRH